MSSPTPRPLAGEPLALDLLNTRWRRDGAVVDALMDTPGLVAFYADHALPVPRHFKRARAELMAAREVILNWMSEQRSAENLAQANRILAHARLSLADGDDTITERVEGDHEHWTLPVRALRSALDLKRTRPKRIRCCAHPQCVLWFVDTSRGGTRRWCSMTTCGNRTKARRHHNRHR